MSKLGERPHILVVDDEPDMCWILENILSSEGYQVTTATSGRKALELVGTNPFQVALIDVKLPDKDGIELATRISEMDAGIVIVMISGYFYPEDRAIQQGLAQGLYVGFISKPFELSEICSAVEKALELAKGGR